MKKERTWNLIGFVAGLILIVVGIVYIATPADHYSTSSTDSAAFGADFYTYEYRATRAAASNAAVAANNLRELGGKLALYNGTLFMVLGLGFALHFGKLVFVEKEETAAAAPAESPAPEPASEEAPTAGQDLPPLE